MANLVLTKEQIAALKAMRERWSVDAEGNIFDSDFEHDVMLRLSGDFASNIQKWEFAKKIADALNKEIP